MKKTVLKIVLSTVVAAGVLFQASAAKKTKVKTVYVGVAIDSIYSHLDENGQLAGYEIELLKKIDEALPQYEFKYETSDLKGILLSLSTKKFDIGVKLFESNDERRKNYLFSDDWYLSFDSYLVTLSSRNDIHTVDDLRGKTVKGGSTVGSAGGTYFENYNKEHNLGEKDKIKVVYSKQTTEEYIAQLKNGSIDAGTSTRSGLKRTNDEFGNVLKIVNDKPIRNSGAYILFNKEQVQLKKDVDVVLHKLITSGELSRLSKELLGYDYTQN